MLPQEWPLLFTAFPVLVLAIAVSVFAMTSEYMVATVIIVVLLKAMPGTSASARCTDIEKMCLEENVRSSERICAASHQFRRSGASDSSSSFYSKLNGQPPSGPPLVGRTFSYDKDKANLYDKYVAEIVETIATIKEKYELHLRNKVAIIVKDAAMVHRIKPRLEVELKKFGIDVRDAATAAATVRCFAAPSEHRAEWVVLDEIVNCDGLEWLIVICVGLEQSPPPSVITAKARKEQETRRIQALQDRSQMYRALTRAQMLVYVINEQVPFGVLSFLPCVKVT